MTQNPRSVLADVVRLWACAPEGLSSSAGLALTIPSGWLLALGRQPALPSAMLRLPPSETVSPKELQPPAVTAPPAVQRRAPLQAPPLVVVAADFQAREQMKQQSQARERLPDLQPEDYGPLTLSTEPRLPLAPKSRWWPALREFAPRKSGGVDLPRLVAHLAQAKPLRSMPLLKRRGQFRELCVLRDVRKAMVPFGADFDELQAFLHAHPQAARLTLRSCHGLPSAVPLTADAVLVLSDLGWSEHGAGEGHRRQWQDWAGRLKLKGVAVQAWVPVGAQAFPSALTSHLDCVPWHAQSWFKVMRRGQGALIELDKRSQAAQVKALLWPRVAVAQRVEPSLLRRTRLALGAAGQPQWESLLWRDDTDLAAGELALQTRPSAVAGWRAAFAALSCDAQLQVWSQLHAQHAQLPRSTLLMERLVWHSHACEAAREQVREPVEQAQNWLRRMAAQEARNTQAQRDAVLLGQAHGLHTGFLQSLVGRNAGDARFTATQQHSFAALAVAAGMAGQGEGVSQAAWLQALPDMELEQGLPWSLTVHAVGPRRALEVMLHPVSGNQPAGMKGSQSVVQSGHRTDALWQPDREAPRPLAPIQDAVPGTLCFKDEMGIHTLKLDTLARPIWASAQGSDAHGIFAELTLAGVFQRMRYLPPGTFLMGSPEGVGHEVEHPQHPVTLSQGLWLAETPCTQALWQAVMGSNPSRFNSGSEAPQRPVDSVSWDDVQQFLAQLNSLLPEGCEAVLPTEAQWEHACRAGTSTAYNWGDESDDSKANYGQGDEHWGDEGTSPVYRYPPNPWGLRDLHGNVWEWCADGQRSYGRDAIRDPIGDTKGEARVVRGGSWFLHPGRARSAYRREWIRVGRAHSRGFRFVLMSSGSHGAEPQPEVLSEAGRSARGRIARAAARRKARRTPSKAKNGPT